MGKASSLKAERKEEKNQLKPHILGSIKFNILSDGHVNVSGPITDPVVVLDVLGKGCIALAAYYAKEMSKDKRIVTQGSNLILPQ